MKADSDGRHWRWHIAILLAYLLLAIALTLPTALHFSTRLPGDGGDDPAIAWNLWWIKYSLLNLEQNPFNCDYLFYPLGINLAFYTLTVLNAFLALPLLLNIGVVAASNSHMLLTFVLNGYGTFLLTRYILAQKHFLFPASPMMASGISGLMVAFASSKLFYVALGQYNIASSHWIPFAVLFILKAWREPSRYRWMILAALFWILQAWSELTYASFILVFLIILYGYHGLLGLFEYTKARIPAKRLKVEALKHMRLLCVLGALFLFGISPFLAMMLPDLAREGDFLSEGSGFAEAFSSDLAGFIIPTKLHPLFGDLVKQVGIRNYDKGQHIYLGFIILALAAIGFWAFRREKESKFWAVAALSFAAFCAGPIITVMGKDSGIVGPFALLQVLPFFKGNRYPSRYGVMLLISLAPLAALGMAWLTNKIDAHSYLKKRPFSPHLAPWIALPISLLYLGEHLSLPLPESDMRIPAAYELIANTPGDFAVLDIPFAWRNGFRITGPIDPGFMFGQFYQTSHQKRLLSGNTSRNPELKFQYFTEAPVLNSLLALETGHNLPPERLEQDKIIASQVVRFFHMRYIVVRLTPGLNPQVTPEKTIPYIESVLPVKKVIDQADVKLYEIILDPLPSSLEIKTGEALTPLYFAEGWGYRQYHSPTAAIQAQRDEVRLLAPLNGKKQRLTASLLLPTGTRRRSLWLEMNGWRSASLELQETHQQIQFDIPAEHVLEGLNDIRLHFDGASPLPARAEADITVISAGMEVGDFAHIYVNGRDISPNLPGYNLAAIDPETGETMARNFNTFRESSASKQFADFISRLPKKTVIAVAVMDTVDLPPEYSGPILSEEAVAALRTLGAHGDLRGEFRWSQAIISGPDKGQIIEDFSPIATASVSNGSGYTEPQVAAGLEWMRFQAVEE